MLERFFDVFLRQSKNARCQEQAATVVAQELLKLWKDGDARIPRNDVRTVRTGILKLREDLGYLCKKSYALRPVYKSKVRRFYIDILAENKGQR